MSELINIPNKPEVEILPLLTAKQAKELTSAGSKEMELQVIGDLIRLRVDQFKYTLEVIDLNYINYVYTELIKVGYDVRISSVTSLKIRWS